MSSLDSKRVRSWSGIRLPVFLYHGEVDTIVPFSHVDLYAEVIPQGNVRRLPGHDHQIDNDLTQVADDIRRLCAGS